ncbi:MAG: hypothetical protein ACOC8F_06425 [Planctomycetota bacterium]
MQERKPVKLSRRVIRALWAAAAFYAIGYLPTLLLRMAAGAIAPMSGSLALAACVIIPFGGKAASLRWAVWRGLFYGTIAGVGIWSALSFGGASTATGGYAAVYIAATAVLCAGVSALFYHLTQKRLRKLEEQW